jgi:cobalt-zinc-cadmium efflux system protein
MTRSHTPEHAGARHRGRLLTVLALVTTFLVVEVIAAAMSGSMALLADAGHMTADVVTLAAAYAATRIAARPDATGTRTYGSYRAEVLASGLAVLVMLGVAVYVGCEAISRIDEQPEVLGLPMLVVGVLGLAVNAVSIVLLRQGSRESINVRGAYLEVIADAAGSMGVIIAAALILWTGNGVWDVVVGLAIAVFVVVRALMLGKEVVAVLSQHTPQGFDLDAAAADLAGLDGVLDVHDLHAWTLTSGMNVATAHLVVEPTTEPGGVLIAAQQLLSEHHHIAHATVQVESEPSKQCDEVRW